MHSDKDVQKKVSDTKWHYAETPFDFGDMIREQIFKREFVYDLLQEQDYSNKTIVDVGCGTAFIGRYLRAHYPTYQYLGIDVSPEAVRIARASGLNVVEGNNLKLTLQNEFCDLTISNGVIHHTPLPFCALKELIRITKKEGLINLYVYKKYHLYHFIYLATLPIRWLYRTHLGKKIIENIIFPIFNACYVQLGNRLYFKNDFRVPRKTSWNIFADQILTPVAHFFSYGDIVSFAERHGLELLQHRLSINGQGLQFLFRRRL
ncbi:MAG: class I SAM-dependent methyltransferase [Candidatus Kaiserbacteria bacterium]|nr:class I SAM-dependent methyltransferase [Candidatus Kaiserbacteria bacterium]